MDVTVRQDYASALRRIRKQLTLSPSNSVLLCLEGDVHLAQHNWQDAEKAYEKASFVQPDWSYPYFALGRLYAASDRYDLALEKTDRTLAADPHNLPALMLKGMICQLRQDYAKAAEQYERILTIRPNFAPAANNLAYLYAEHLARPEAAFDLARKAREVAPDDPAIADTLGWIAYRRGDYKWALSLLEESAEKLPEDPEVLYHLAATYCALGRENAAQDALRRALAAGKHFPGLKEATMLAGILTIELPSVDQTMLPQIKTYLDWDPKNPSALTRLGAAYEANGNRFKARAAYEAALASNPQFVPAMVRLIEICAAQPKEIDAALALGRKARDAAPTDPAVAAALGWTACRKGDYSWGHSLLAEAVQKHPDNPQWTYRLGVCRYHLGDIAGGVELVKKALGAMREDC